MSGPGFGPAPRGGCQHNYAFRELGGVAFRCCEGCGETHLLWQFDNGEMALLPVPLAHEDGWKRVQEERRDERRPDMGEDLHALRADAGEQPVPPKPVRRRRTAQSVSKLQEREQPTRQEGEART